MSEIYDDSGDLSPLPSYDYNHWYYPAPGYESEDEPIHSNVSSGNWGRKMAPGARWARRGKKAAWGPGMGDWEADERARKRLRLLLPELRERSASPPPSLPHLRSPSPPAEAPYAPPVVQHHNFTSFVMDGGVTHSFRSRLVEDLERATDNLIRGENPLRMAFGRLWQVLADNTALSETQRKDQATNGRVNGVKTNGTGTRGPEHEEEEDEEEATSLRDGQIVAEDHVRHIPDLDPPAFKHFLSVYPAPLPRDPISVAPSFGLGSLSTPMAQQESLAKSLMTLRVLQDDGREYMERLVEIREGLGDAKYQRQNVWKTVREAALKELQEAAGVTS